ncbi:MAG: DUF4956 domain-containing protein [Caldilineaceae bacterium]|nr:DUF4956 domain-containing protein [Caldilineaceae bacterium]MCB9137312.1 DUF4956 domain-containing protein [Caldilineaceae bacterium]
MNFIDLFSGFIINLVIAVIIVRGIYYPIKQDKNYIFTYIAFNTIIYFVMAFLSSTEMSVGVGFGLFAIFSVLRYRTNTMSTREMTYLFIFIALPVMNSILMRNDAWPTLLAVNAAIIAVLFVLEHEWGFHYERAKSIRYDRVDLATPQNYAAMVDDLRRRTGLPVNRVEVGNLNFLSDTADITVYYDEPQMIDSPSGEHPAYINGYLAETPQF